MRALLALLLSAGPVFAAECDSRAATNTLLAERYAEVPRFAGLLPNGAVLEVYVSAAGTWTVAITSPDAATTCLVSAGIAAVILPEPKPGRLN